MPIYEYQCTDCGKTFEVLQRMNEKPELKCNSCDGSNIQRVLSPGSFVFKGSGFYATDYKNGHNGKGKKSEVPSCETCSESGGCPAAGADK
ncbi:MAG: zinc ribbon domain-containing protein [Candidatus Glassbacteria bacterium]